ncbi:MAG: FAD-dependent oxidoreductase [Phycisphaeraceae bacterium]|nr:FAD-dependent oxidoreductase [Phycisphaeraceae bacterium]
MNTPDPHQLPCSPGAHRHGQVAVLGGGLAGMAAAVRLAEAGVKVHLIETRKFLGGRTASFIDPVTGQTFDNCQHVLLGCCTYLIDFYARLGVLDRIAWHRRLNFLDSQNRLDTLEADDLPAPFHLTRSLLGFKSFSIGEKLAIARGMLAMMRLGAAGRKHWTNRSFAQWLSEHRQPPGAIRKFWTGIVAGAINETPQRVAASYAFQVFQDGFLAHEDAYLMGLSTVPLAELYGGVAERIQKAGGLVTLGCSAESFEFDSQRITALRLEDGRKLNADYYLSALPFDRLQKLCPPPLLAADPRLKNLLQIQVSPILGIHLCFEVPPGRPLMDLPHVVLTESPLHWIFNKPPEPPPAAPPEAPPEAARRYPEPEIRNPNPVGSSVATMQYLHGVISAAHQWVDVPAEEITRMAVAEIQKAFPAARSARLRHARVIKEKRATFSAQPGIDSLRPPATGPVANLVLAGDWCQTGWPATMEGAVRSGYAAAEAILKQ